MDTKNIFYFFLISSHVEVFGEETLLAFRTEIFFIHFLQTDTVNTIFNPLVNVTFYFVSSNHLTIYLYLNTFDSILNAFGKTFGLLNCI